jgi:hypothetical protein
VNDLLYRRDPTTYVGFHPADPVLEKPRSGRSDFPDDGRDT